MMASASMLKFHESEACEGIIQHLERRERTSRRDVNVRDKGNHTSPNARVEMTFFLGDQLYAIEHTGIEPFDGFLEHQNRATALFEPLAVAIASVLSTLLTPSVVIEMHMPVDAFIGRQMHDVHALHAALVEWVRATAPILPPMRYAYYRGALVTAQPAGIPFTVSLVRFDGIAGMRGRFQIKHLAPGSGDPRTLRIERACDKNSRSSTAGSVRITPVQFLCLRTMTCSSPTFLPWLKPFYPLRSREPMRLMRPIWSRPAPTHGMLGRCWSTVIRTSIWRRSATLFTLK